MAELSRIIGSSAAALTGLQVVVIALTADLRGRSSARGIEAVPPS